MSKQVIVVIGYRWPAIHWLKQVPIVYGLNLGGLHQDTTVVQMLPPECPHMRTLVKFICLRTFCHSAYDVPEISGNCHFVGKKTFVHLFFRFYLVMSSLSYVTKHDSLSLCPFFRSFFLFLRRGGSLKLFACPSVYLPLYMPIQTTV